MENNNHRSLIKELNDLYFIQRGHYLIQYKDGYSQFTAGQLNKNGKKIKSIMDWHFENHLLGEFTVGTFGGKVMSKFMTFDVDFHDLEMAKWITYKLTNTLNSVGINSYYISFSGSKGYHIDIFFNDLIQISDAEKFFNHVIHKSDVTPYSDEGNKVEFRVTDKQGVKLPLGIHQKTGNYCGFCLIENGLKVMSKKESEQYLFSIKKISHTEILNIIEEHDGIELVDKKELIKVEDAISPHTRLKSYEQSEDYSISLAMDILQNGLKVQGSRHKSILLIGMYLKYSGVEQNQCKEELHAWMEWQDTNTYTTPLLNCHKDIDQTVKDIYERNYNLSSNTKDITVTYDEIKWIIENCPEKNQKLITYAMLIHSKRHANLKGIFYMPFKDIQEATGLYNEAVQNQVNKLSKMNVIEIVERNRKPKGTGLQKKLPNLYRINFGNIEESHELISKVSINKDDLYKTNVLNNIDLCMRFYFTDKELKKMLTRNQYTSIVG
jgi:DNA-binding Lrp family transcriptional regulator